MPGTRAWLSAIVLAVICTAVAYAIFFTLLTRSGAMATSSVTFLIPVFAILWGTTIGERVDAQLFLGMLVTLAGTALAVGLVAPGRKPALAAG
jgi:drug/metabolite transporter (DMT)-like permease